MQTVFWCSTAFILYTYFVYPLLMFGLAGRKPQLKREQAVTPSVAVVIVAHNEAQSIANKISNIQAQDAAASIQQIIIVSDASTDATESIVAELQQSDSRIELHVLPQPSGKAAGINLGMTQVKAEMVVFADVRQTFEPQAISELLACFVDDSVAGVAGELRFRKVGEAHVAESIGLYWKYETWIRASESGFYSLTGAPGAIYAIRAAYFVALPPQLILDDVWLPMHIVLAGKRVVYCPTAVAWDYAQEKGAKEFKRKVRTLAGNIELVALQPKTISPFSNAYWWMFVSHKLFRMLVPYALLLAFLSNLIIAEGWYMLTLLIQLLFYALGYLGARREGQVENSSACKLCAVSYVFIMLNVAAVYGLFFYLKGKHNTLWNT